MTKHQTKRKLRGKTDGRSRPSLRSAQTSSPHTVPQFLLLLLTRLLQKCPLTFWGVLAAVPVATAVLALSMLLSPGYVAEHATAPSPSPTPSVPDLPKPVPPPLPSSAEQADSRQVRFRPIFQPQDGARSLLALSVIAVTCAGGTLLVSRYLTQPQPVRRLIKAPDRPRVPARNPSRGIPAASPPSGQGSTRRAPQAELAHAVRSRPTAIQPIAPQPAAVPRKVVHAVSVTAAQPAAATVLPPDQTHALDWDENSLVNSMDIRKRRSVSSWM